uniref:Uncharacterized protein n=1 Tax=Musa acuminata subsp. malaccensis TaxID=214687 RepID=A0A804U5N1_MUSAM
MITLTLLSSPLSQTLTQSIPRKRLRIYLFEIDNRN